MEKPDFIDRAGFALRPLVNETVQKAGPATDPWSAGVEEKAVPYKVRALATGSR
jgi:hypothetical protein